MGKYLKSGPVLHTSAEIMCFYIGNVWFDNVWFDNDVIWHLSLEAKGSFS